MYEKIIIVDLGSQFTQLIARQIRDFEVYCEIIMPQQIKSFDFSFCKGIILSGSHLSVTEAEFITTELKHLPDDIHLLGICFGAQWLAHSKGGMVNKSHHREFGRAKIKLLSTSHLLFNQVPLASTVWMSHSDSIVDLPTGFNIIAHTESIPVAAFGGINTIGKSICGLQFHPEVSHSEFGSLILKNFIFLIAQCTASFTPQNFIQETVESIKNSLSSEAQIIMALSGGVDSTVAATLIHKAVGHRLHCIFIDNGLLRKNEYKEVLEIYKQIGLDVRGINKTEYFYAKLNGVSDPETKRKIIGGAFIDIFQEEAQKLNCDYLGQGTIYPDVIESNQNNGVANVIKSHHNVGGLPDKMHLKLVEPIRMLFKDEVRKIGLSLGISKDFIFRHPFPGPGLAIRILGDITEDKVSLLQEADSIFIQHLKEQGLYDQVWQAGTILLPLQTVGVMGDERSYEQVIALRAVTSRDGMTADWAELPFDFLKSVSNKIINQVKGINRVVYDISSKPPATIEWE
ncbi:MAG: glutamine-hydrolyzing GMP synthase [Sediminibacterium sp.]|nr:glutamine-hydrolyzing GMP synthase [Sediminibacterium sp.]